MPTYVPNYKYDIFVSYAHVDNELLPGAQTGWVTTLIDALNKLLAQKLGRADAYTLWMDYELRGNTSVTPAIYEQLDNSALLLLVFSPAYLASQWCRLELNTFVAKVGNDSGRIFMVEYQPAERIIELADLLGYRFWESDLAGKPRTLGIPKPNPDKEYHYYQKLDDLASELSDKLQQLKAQAKSTEPNDSIQSITVSPKVTLFLAEVTDDLALRRDELKRNLELQGIPVLPDKLYFFPTQEELQQAIDTDLKKSVVFVQLLSPCLAYRPLGMSTPQLQYERAQALGLPILQWRERHLDLDEITNHEQRTLLSASTVMATGIVEFQQHLFHTVQKLEAEQNASAPSLTSETSQVLVFINTISQAIPLAQQIRDILATHGLGCSLPLDITVTTSPEEIRENLEDNLLCCDAVLVLYDSHTPAVWVHKQLLYCHRIAAKRDNPLKAIAVCNQSDTTHSPVNISLPNLHILNCPSLDMDRWLPNLMHVLQP
jgi:hypothetical protein